MKFKPLGDLLIVEPAAREAYIGTILLAESARVEAKHGKVIAVGPGKKNENGWTEPMDVRVGDTVLYSEYAKEHFKHQGRELLTLHQADVIGILE